ncbi:uncharacterized protein LOC103022408 [Astyanax mexicanus]|uniref:Uncharacterized LOC103022408 n=2 Tax=Astyanax mexicanus TaxID=7994 RepID=A0A8B9LK22_ASTMX|nr:uncharacterized protein LOC103022408 [Astyanax mexicanus]KAG9270225.1 hypothetical protein AMEX_G15148 [Astyanax mexicanus]
MEEIRPLVFPRQQETNELPSPNLQPRHRELLPTPCGPIKRWSELPGLVKVYFCFTLCSLLALLILTLINIQKESQGAASDDDLTVSLIQLVSILFCMYYITRGVLQENRQELIVFVLSVIVVMVRSVANFSVLQSHDPLLMARFVCILCVGLLHVICGVLLIQTPNMMAFRVGGALESLQEQYFILNLCFSMVTFDLQAQLCLCILILTSGTSVSYFHTIILGIGVVWACLTAATGAIAVLKEVKLLVWIFFLQNLPQLAYFIYLLYSIITQWGESKTYTLEAAAITGCVVSVVIKSVLFWGLYRLYHSFGQGLRERMFASDNH